MKTEEAPCKGAPSSTQISYSLYNVKDGVAEESPHTGVTYSPCSTESPQKFYITPRFEKTKKEHTDAYYETAVRMFSGIDPCLTPFDTLVLDQMVAWVKKPDAFMICGAEKCGNWFGVSKATAQASLNRLEKCGYFRCFKKGNGRGNASKYVLGELYSKGRREWIQEQLLANEYSSRPQNFVRTKPKGKPRGKPFIKGERVQKSATFNNTERVQKSAHKGCKNLLSQPIDQPIDTHIESKREASPPDAPSIFSLENWLYRGKNEHPDWDERDLLGSYESAVRNGVNGTWKLYQDKCYACRLNAPTARILASVKDPALAQSVLAKAEARIRESNIPTYAEWLSYAELIKWRSEDAETAFDYYQSIGWEVGEKAVKDWRAIARNCHRRDDSR